MDKKPAEHGVVASSGDQEIQRVRRTRAECRAFYNRISRSYDRIAARSEAPLRRKGLELLSAAPGETALEIGPGTGQSLADLATSVGSSGRALGIDLAEAMTFATERKLEQGGVRRWASVACGDVLQLPVRDRCIDALFSSFCLELFDTPDIPRMLAECRRVLKPNGRLVVVSLSRQPHDFAVKAYEWLHRHFPNLADCRPIHVEESLQDAGFRIEQSLLEHMWVPVEIVLGHNPG